MKGNKIFKSAVFVLMSVFMVFSVAAPDRVVDQIVAIVGGNIVLKSDIEKMFMAQQAQGIPSDGDMKC